jgi:hypothetical protein
MEVTVRLFGLELLHIAASTEDAGCERVEECGDVTTYPLGFTATHELPDEAGLRDRQEWGE